MQTSKTEGEFKLLMTCSIKLDMTDTQRVRTSYMYMYRCVIIALRRVKANYDGKSEESIVLR